MLWDCARAPNPHRFELCMEALNKHKPRAHQWLVRKVHPRHWSRAFFKTETKSDLLINNHCEIFNSFILSARDKPIITMMQRIRLLLMARIRKYRDMMMKHEDKICPRIADKLRISEKESYKFSCTWSGGDDYEVSTPYSSYVVNLKDRSCSCRRFQLSGIPCWHACKAILHNQEKLEDYVDDCYHTSTYLKTYSNILTPLNGKEMWPKSQKTPLTPPVIEVQPGRRKKARNKKNDEPRNRIKLGKKGVQMHCTKCGQTGHNVRRCKRNASGESSAQGNKRPAPETSTAFAEVNIIL